MTIEILVAGVLHVLAQGGPVSEHQAREVRAAAPVILAEAIYHDQDPLLLAAVIIVESDFVPRTSPAGAVGLAGILPRGSATAGYRRASARALAQRRLNLHLAARHLSRLRDLCGGPPDRWTSVYNGRRRCRPSVYSDRVMDRYARLMAAVGRS